MSLHDLTRVAVVNLSLIENSSDKNVDSSLFKPFVAAYFS